MKNQMIHDVPRELLEELRNVCGNPDLAEQACVLLDQSVLATCKFDYSSMNAEQRLAFCRGEI